MSTQSQIEDQLLALYYDVDKKMSELEDAQRKFLNAAGWKHSSIHPDCRWYWSKVIGGRQYTFRSIEDAIQMQLETMYE